MNEIIGSNFKFNKYIYQYPSKPHRLYGIRPPDGMAAQWALAMMAMAAMSTDAFILTPHQANFAQHGISQHRRHFAASRPTRCPMNLAMGANRWTSDQVSKVEVAAGEEGDASKLRVKFLKAIKKPAGSISIMAAIKRKSPGSAKKFLIPSIMDFSQALTNAKVKPACSDGILCMIFFIGECHQRLGG